MLNRDFNPRSHERSDVVSSLYYTIWQISIHAPTRGATDFASKSLKSSSISIHAPTRGATALLAIRTATLRFQSTLPREERPCFRVTIRTVDVFQSTLPREERPAYKVSFYHCWNFNPRSHERSDEADKERRASNNISIHAPTRGATVTVRRVQQLTQISIHAPTRGATMRWQQLISPESISIHAPTRGATPGASGHKRNPGHFNPRSHERSDLPST